MSPFIPDTKHLLNNLLPLWLSLQKHPNITTLGPAFPPRQAATGSGATSVGGGDDDTLPLRAPAPTVPAL